LCSLSVWTAKARYLGISNNPRHRILVQEEFEDTKGVIRIRKSKDKQHNGQKKKYKRTNNNLY